MFTLRSALACLREQSGCQPVDCFEIGQVDRYECRGTADRTNIVVKLLKSALATGQRDDMGASLRQSDGGGPVDSARSAAIRPSRILPMMHPAKRSFGSPFVQP